MPLIAHRRLLLLTLFFSAAAAWPGLGMAHSLLLMCKRLPEDMVRCVGEFSDGSDAAGISLQVRSYDDRVLLRGTLDGRSSLEFKRPGGDYFVRVEDGGEHSAEVDHADVQP